MAAEGFFRRWAKRKAESGKPTPSADSRTGDDIRPVAPPHPLPTIEDVQNLTPESDYSLFVAQGIDPAVRRAALKTLFSDPHFNLMDGLDIYIGDYTRHAPLTPAMLAALQHARSITPAADKSDHRDDQAEVADTAEPETAILTGAADEPQEQAAQQAAQPDESGSAPAPDAHP